MTKLPWRYGQLPLTQEPMVVSATRFTYKSGWDLFGVYWHGLRLRRAWPRFAGSIGVSLSADLSRRSTYTVSLWRSEEDLKRFISHPEHLVLMRAYRPRMESIASATWTVESFDLGEAWRKARQLLSGASRVQDGAAPTHLKTEA